jgi:hypothetical protein
MRLISQPLPTPLGEAGRDLAAASQPLLLPQPCHPRRWSGPSLLGLLMALLLLLTPLAPAQAATEEAVLAGGCFWCLEHDLEELSGVLDVESGYSGGKKPNPTYQEVSAGGTGYQ